MTKALLAAALVSSVCLKAWTIAAAYGGEDTNAGAKLLSFLADAGFSASRLGDPWMVSGKAAPCRVLLGSVAADGWHRDVVFNSAPAGSEVVFFFQGRVFPDQPKWRTWATEKMYQLKHTFDSKLKPDLVIASAIDRRCSVDKQLWAKRLEHL
jgi:hypothetical protein